MYSILSCHCPLEVKIRYAWCIYDLIGAGEIGAAVLKVILMHVLGLTEKDLSEVNDCERPLETGEADDTAQSELDHKLELSKRVKGGRKLPQGAPAPPARTRPAPAPAAEDASLDDLDDLHELMIQTTRVYESSVPCIADIRCGARANGIQKLWHRRRPRRLDTAHSNPLLDNYTQRGRIPLYVHIICPFSCLAK